jgi:hypothetical protein
MEARNKNNFPEKEMLSRFLNGELKDSEIDIFIDQIKFNEPDSEYGAGVKKFLEDNNYDVNKILLWRSSARNKVENKLANKLSWTSNKWLKIAAVLVVCLSTYFIVFNTTSSTPSWEATYAKDLGFPVFMGKNNDKQWMESYRASNYAESLNLINEALETKPTNDTLLYYRIVCLFETNSLQLKKSISIAKGEYYYEKTKLIFAYQYWKNGGINKAIEIFTGLSKSKFEEIKTNSLQAIEVLKDVD